MTRYSEIFEVTWNPEACEPFGDRREITRAFVAFGDPVPVMRPRRAGRKRENQASSPISSRVTERNARSKLGRSVGGWLNSLVLEKEIMINVLVC
jgi:hypothetical protein